MNVDRIARIYRSMEYLAFGRTLERCRTAQLAVLRNTPRRVLILGEGDGRFLGALLERFPAARVDVLELSGRMIALARGRLSPTLQEQVTFVHGDALRGSLSGAGPYDLVVTNFFLDCLSATAAQTLINKVASLLNGGAFWIVGEFQIPAAGFRRLHATLWVKTMYFFFRFATGLTVNRLPEYESILLAAGLRLLNERKWRWGLVVSRLYELRQLR